MGEEKAWDVKQKLSIAYAIIAWNVGGYVIYQIATGNKNWPITHGIRSKDEDMVRPAIAWAAALGIEKGEVIRINRDWSTTAPAKFEIDIDRELKKKILGREYKVHDPTPTPYTIIEGEDMPPFVDQDDKKKDSSQ